MRRMGKMSAIVVVVACLALWSSVGQSALADTNPAGMISFWQLDEGTGTIAGDSAGPNDGTITAATWTSGILGGALSFNGSSARVVVSDSPSFSSIATNRALTVEAWFRLVPPFPDHEAPIIAKWGPGAAEDDEWTLTIQQSDGRLRFEMNGSTTLGGPKTFLWSPDPVSLDEWHHVAATWDGNAGTAALYLDGVRIAFTDSAISSMPDTSQELTIGYYHNTFYFNGPIDEVAVYNRALSQEEIQERFARGTLGEVGGTLGEVGATLSLMKVRNPRSVDIPGRKLKINVDGTVTEGSLWLDCTVTWLGESTCLRAKRVRSEDDGAEKEFSIRFKTLLIGVHWEDGTWQEVPYTEPAFYTVTLWRLKVRSRDCTDGDEGDPCDHCEAHGYHLEGQVDSVSGVATLPVIPL